MPAYDDADLYTLSNVWGHREVPCSFRATSNFKDHKDIYILGVGKAEVKIISKLRIDFCKVEIMKISLLVIEAGLDAQQPTKDHAAKYVQSTGFMYTE